MKNLYKIIKEKPTKSLSIFIIFSVLILLFYWYEIRPASIRIRCAPRSTGGTVYRCDWDCHDIERMSYEYCIHGYGLKQ